jgi:hypothetical protein
MVLRLSLLDLWGIAGGIGIVGAGSSLFLIKKNRNQVRKEPYYVNAFKTLKQNRAAIELIGEPIYQKSIDFDDTENNCFQTLSTRLKVPFQGLKKSGHLFIWADREDVNNEWILRRLEIIFSDIEDKKVIVYKNETNKESK